MTTSNFLKIIFPTLWRFSRVFNELGRGSDFYPIFAIYVLDISFKVAFFFVLLAVLFQKINLRVSHAPSVKENLSFLFLLALCLYMTVDLIVGPYNIREPGAFSNRLIEGGYLSGVFLFCVTIPGANFIFYFLLYARNGRSFQYDTAQATF